MKAFRQTIQELSVNDKLDKLGHNKPLSGSRLKQLTRDFSAYEDIDLDQWQGYPPPRNSSQVTKNEIHNLVSLGQFRDQWEKDMVMHDKKVIQAFREYLDKHGLEVDLDRIDDLLKQASPILLSLKRFYNRPRPNVLAKKLGLALTFFPLTTAETPSYPSGHATQGRLVAKLVADEVPFEHRRNILDIGTRIGHSRQIAGAHYQSDTEFGHRLGDELYRLASTRKEPELKLEDVWAPSYFLTESPLSGRVTNYGPPDHIAGGFYKYVEINKELQKKPYVANKDAKVYDVETHEIIPDLIIKKGGKFKLLDFFESDLKQIGRSLAVRINYKGKEYLIRLSDILKPTGKNVENVKVSLRDKDPAAGKVFIPFRPGNAHEAQVAKLFIDGSGPAWEFEHKGKQIQITQLRAPNYRGPGYPKTDLYVKFDQSIKPFGTEMKISLKKDNAGFIESWITPETLERIFGKGLAIKIAKKGLALLTKGGLGPASKAPYGHFNIYKKKDKLWVKTLDGKEAFETYSGTRKFKAQKEAAANCYYQGTVPENITTFIDNCVTMKSMASNYPCYLKLRGYGEQTSGAFVKVKIGKKEHWEFSPRWKAYYGLK